MRVNNVDYISLIDLARYKSPDNLGDDLIKWMSNKNSFDFYSLCEEFFNENFKLAELCEFKNDVVNNLNLRLKITLFCLMLKQDTSVLLLFQVVRTRQTKGKYFEVVYATSFLSKNVNG